MYSFNCGQYNESVFTMRPILISEDDGALFNANFTPRVVVIYQNNIREIRRMVRQQGIGFWIRFITSFRSHNERHRLMDGIVFPRAEAVFVDMLHLLTSGDNFNELTRLVLSLGAMHAAIIANDYHVLMDPMLRVATTFYDKPLDGLRLYFRFAAGLVAVFRRWRQVSWRGEQEGEGWLPWQPPLHWLEATARDYSEWTLEGRLLHAFEAQLPGLLGLPPGLPSWLPDNMKVGHVLCSPIPLQETPFPQNGISRNNRNKKKGRRRKNRHYNEDFSEYESQPVNANHSSGDSGVCLIEQSQKFDSVEHPDPQEAIMSRHTADSEKYGEEFAERLVMESQSTALKDKNPVKVIQPSSNYVHLYASKIYEQSIETKQDNFIEKSTSVESSPKSPVINTEIPKDNEAKESELSDGSAAIEISTRQSHEFNKETLTASEYLSPASEMRRHEQDTQHLQQKKERQPLILASIEEKFSNVTGIEIQNPGCKIISQNNTVSETFLGNKNQWQDTRKVGIREVTTNEISGDSAMNSKVELANASFKSSSLLESNVNIFQQSGMYALAVCGTLGKQSKKSPEIQKQESVNKLEHFHTEIMKSKFSPCDKQNEKNVKGKSRKQSKYESCEKYGKLFSKERIIKNPEMIKKYSTKPQNNNAAFDFGKSKTNKGKVINKVSFPSESTKFDQSNKDFENLLPSHLDKDSKLEVRRSNMPSEEKEQDFARRRKWKSVWTRRRETDIHQQENFIAESNMRRERKVSNNYESNRRKCMPQNVPDILKQVENSELKAFWNKNFEAPKSSRKSRISKRVLKWRQMRDTSSRTEFYDNSRNNHSTPVVKLDIIPAIEPKDFDSPSRDVDIEMHLHRVAKDQCCSKIGWYEETLAEDKDREIVRELSSHSNKNDSIGGLKEYKHRNWKRKQRNNRNAKMERNIIEPYKKESQTQDLIVFQDINTNKMQKNNFENNIVQSKPVIHENKLEVLHNSESFKSDTSSNKSSINVNYMMPVKEKQTNKGQLIKQVTLINGNCSQDIFDQNSIQNIDQNSNDNMTFNPTITQQVQLHIHMNLEYLQSVNQLLPKIKQYDEEAWNRRVDCCRLILVEILHNIPENINNSQIGTDPEYKSPSQSLKKHQLRSRNISTLDNIDSCCRNKGSEAVTVYKRRQACVVRTLEFLVSCKFNITLSSMRNLFRSRFMNKEILKFIEKFHMRDPGSRISTSLFHAFSSLSIGDPESLLFVPRKKLRLRCCDKCNILEKFVGEYGECIHCKNISTPLPHVYCRRICQYADWKLRHRSEHKHDFELNRSNQFAI